ncbi:hypothetical protein BJ170DRAFT_592247 [Xylariales sp. AK1849]|nr:hypothetical protein BJ170DRAFT_592247 [Xylariales sp. AK1849]
MNSSSTVDCTPSADNYFGPTVHGCRDGFDFTLTFEHCYISIVPASLLLIAAPFSHPLLEQSPHRYSQDIFEMHQARQSILARMIRAATNPVDRNRSFCDPSVNPDHPLSSRIGVYAPRLGWDSFLELMLFRILKMPSP